MSRSKLFTEMVIDKETQPVFSRFSFIPITGVDLPKTGVIFNSASLTLLGYVEKSQPSSV